MQMFCAGARAWWSSFAVVARLFCVRNLLNDSFRPVVIHVEGDPEAIAVADVNHDDAADIILADPQSGTVTVLLGDGNGSLRKAPGSPTLSPLSRRLRVAAMPPGSVQ